jgi:hypothetical protein
MVFSNYMNPDINSLFNNNLCCNVRGKIKMKSNYSGIINSLIENPKMVFFYK